VPTIKISEMFYSVQGEIDVGKPCLFVRFSGCNLIKENQGCSWCDTKYAEEGQVINVHQIVDRIVHVPSKRIVITGGEPLYQSQGLFRLISECALLDVQFNIETNGTIFDSRLAVFSFMITVINCSPKKQCINLRELTQFSLLQRTRFKFVYERGEDKWWEALIRTLKIDKDRVWIMPQGATREEQLGLSEEVIEYCKEMGFNFTPRLQILVWGPRRGV